MHAKSSTSTVFTLLVSVSSLRSTHWFALSRIVQCGTLLECLPPWSILSFTLRAFIDADRAGDISYIKSMSVLYVFVGDSLIC